MTGNPWPSQIVRRGFVFRFVELTRDTRQKLAGLRLCTRMRRDRGAGGGGAGGILVVSGTCANNIRIQID